MPKFSVDTSAAEALEGVEAVVTAADCPLRFGPLLQDRPALAAGRVRYAGEPVAIVVAKDEATAARGVEMVHVRYAPLPFLLRPAAAAAKGAPLLHPELHTYKKAVDDIYPLAQTNIVSHYRMRKGDPAAAFRRSAHLVERSFTLPPSDHSAMEVRSARAAIDADGAVHIVTASQAPYTVRQQLAEAFRIPAGQIRVEVPFVGGGFGGKAPVFLEILAYLASRKVKGRPVRLVITREEDMASAPCRLGLEARIRLGSDNAGRLQAAEMTYYLDTGAYSDTGPYMTKAIAVDCTGPYRVENLYCDAFTVYTNHTYATSYRGFGHESCTFCMERTLDALAAACRLDPLELRLRNAIGDGDRTPSQVPVTMDLVGDLPQCLEKLKTLAEWKGSRPLAVKNHTVRATGVACFWKTENPPTDAISGAVVTANSDGSFNLNTGVVEMGSGSQTHLAQILAERLGIDAGKIHVVFPVDTRVSPEHWKTVASLTEYMAGLAVLRAADDLLCQLRTTAAQTFRCPPQEIEVAGGRVFRKGGEGGSLALKDLVAGFKDSGGASLGEPALGRGVFMLKGLSSLDPATGKGKTGPAWTVGAQAVEVEVDTQSFTYRILNASTVIDVGKAINPAAMTAMVAGGMAMGISLGSREQFRYDGQGMPKEQNLRTYKPLHIGQEPDYRVGFVETPESEAPYGLRSYSEHGLLGIPAALANALSSALNIDLCQLPATPEMLWRLAEGNNP